MKVSINAGNAVVLHLEMGLFPSPSLALDSAMTPWQIAATAFLLGFFVLGK
jgi:hypothetical protein